MKKQLPKRNELNVNDTWDLTLLFKTELDYNQTFEKFLTNVAHFKSKYEHALNDSQTIEKALNDFSKLQETMIRLSHYEYLASAVDSSDELNQLRSAEADLKFNQVASDLSFINNELYKQSDAILKEVYQINPDYKVYVMQIIEDKKHRLSDELENALISLSPILHSPYRNYNQFKLADMRFQDFEVDGKMYSNSFTLFENEYEYEHDPKIRRKAYEAFYDTLSMYQNGFASNYIAHLQKEKAMSKLRGFDSIFDYLLYDQKVPKAFMDRQIDLIITKLAPAFRKYATLLKELNHLDEMTYADLKIAIDSEFEVKVTIDEAKNLVKKGLSVFGADYMHIVNEALNNRWIDFPQNQGKSTGGFCSSPYGANSYILLNWNGQMDEVMVLAHELGHAGHFQYANKTQNIYQTDPSLYFIEAPSTTNELMMNLVLEKEAKTPREKRYIKSVMIARTYYHNFVTHLLEAAFQRKVYELVDRNQPLSVRILNDIKLNILKDFWGDAVVIPDYAGLTWMRQPHYFMGLYPYTYSAGLSIGTVVAKNILNQTLNPNDWIEVLKAGGTKTPFELTQMVGLDISSDQVMLDAINFISQTIDEIAELSKTIKL